MAKKEELGFVVVGIRHFENGEHHWMSPSVDSVEDWIDAEAFAEDGKVRKNAYYKPVYTSLADAERYAMKYVHGEISLAQWEKCRPTMYVLEEEQYIAIVERDNYNLPKEAERWGDAKVADYERECDCEDIQALAVWDSDTDEESHSEKVLRTVYALNGEEGMKAWVTDDDCDSFEVDGLEDDTSKTIEWVNGMVITAKAKGELPQEISVGVAWTEGKTVHFTVK